MAADTRGDRNAPIYAGYGASADAEDLTELGALATELGTRRVGTSDERAALDADWLFDGLLFFETNTGFTYRRVANAWKVIATPWVDFTPSYSGFNQGRLDLRKYQIRDGSCEVRFRYSMATNGRVVGNPKLILPVQAASWLLDGVPVGYASAFDSSATGRYVHDVLYSQGDNSISPRVNSGGPTSPWNATTPFGWDANDWIDLQAVFPIA